MSDADKKFDKAVEIVGNLPSDGENKPTQKEQLEFYGLFKQAKVGNVDKPRPGLMDPQGKYKWDAWKSKEDMSQEDAKIKYVELLRSFLEKWSDKEEAKKLLDQIDAA